MEKPCLFIFTIVQAVVTCFYVVFDGHELSFISIMDFCRVNAVSWEKIGRLNQRASVFLVFSSRIVLQITEKNYLQNPVYIYAKLISKPKKLCVISEFADFDFSTKTGHAHGFYFSRAMSMDIRTE